MVKTIETHTFSMCLAWIKGGDTAGGPVTWCYDSGSESAVSFGTPVAAAQHGESWWFQAAMVDCQLKIGYLSL